MKCLAIPGPITSNSLFIDEKGYPRDNFAAGIANFDFSEQILISQQTATFRPPPIQ